MKGWVVSMDLEHEKRLTEVEARSKSNAHRLEEVEKKQNDLSELVGTVKVLATKQEGVENDVKEIKNDVKTLTGKPGKRWEGLISQLVTLVVAAVVGFILAKIGL
jgi:seryl-tRNA synthetase